MIKYDTIKEICDKAEARGIKISELCLEDQSEQMGLPKEENLRNDGEEFRCDGGLRWKGWG